MVLRRPGRQPGRGDRSASTTSAMRVTAPTGEHYWGNQGLEPWATCRCHGRPQPTTSSTRSRTVIVQSSPIAGALARSTSWQRCVAQDAHVETGGGRRRLRAGRERRGPGRPGGPDRGRLVRRVRRQLLGLRPGRRSRVRGPQRDRAAGRGLRHGTGERIRHRSLRAPTAFRSRSPMRASPPICRSRHRLAWCAPASAGAPGTPPPRTR